MDNKTKGYFIAALIAIIGALGVLLSQLQEDDPIITSSTTSSSTSMPSTSSMSSSTSVALAPIDFYGAKNQTILFRFVLSEDKCINGVEGLNFPYKIFQAGTVITKYKSFKGATVGDYEDPMYEVNGLPCKAGNYYAEIKIPLDSNSGVHSFNFNDDAFSLYVFNFYVPTVASLPTLIEMTSQYAWNAHYGLLNPLPWSKQQPITDLYAQALVDHRMNPYKHYMSSREDYVRHSMDTSPSYVVLPINGYTYQTSYSDFTDAKLATAEKLAKEAIAKGIIPLIYLFDEPSTYIISNSIPTLVSLVKAKVPSAKVMITTKFNQSLSDLGVDFFNPVAQHYTGKEKMFYVSCMSHGCGNYEGDSGEPDLSIDRDNEAYVRSIYWLAFKNDQTAVLYYNSVEFYKRSTPNPFTEALWIGGGSNGGGWDFSGNGDGTLFYPDYANEKPIASKRLKALRTGSYDYEYLKLAKEKGISINNPVTDWKVWSKNIIDYEKEIIRLGLLIEKE